MKSRNDSVSSVSRFVDTVHISVLEKEVLSHLNVRPGGRYIDATADGGGHAVAILRAATGGSLLALEWDPELFSALEERFQKEFPGPAAYQLRSASYTELESIASEAGFIPADGILFDLGVSSYHLDRSGRGFSFQKDEPLDMRFDPSSGVSAAELVRTLSESEISRIIHEYSDDRLADRIARQIVNKRVHQPIRSTRDLVEVIRMAIPRGRRERHIHFATRTFQALRIAVNHEFENVAKGLKAAARIIAIGGRIAVISFHSGEDRIVKSFFRERSIVTCFRPVIKKPLRPSEREALGNPRARSAKLRIFEKIK